MEEQKPIEIIEKEIDDRCKRRITELMEQYAQAKVLEALEREFIKIGVFKGNGKAKTGIDYFETEVKPKYKQINK